MAKGPSLKVFSHAKGSNAPLRFAGDASSIRAELWMENEGGEELRLKSASVHSPTLKRYGSPLAARLSLPAGVLGGERKRISTSFSIQPTTPPDTYPGELRVETASGATISLPVEIIVTQNYELSLEPDEFVFSAAGGATVSGELIVRNEGNVPVHVTEMGSQQLLDALEAECREGCQELAEKPDEDIVSIEIRNESLTVEPGTWALVRFTAKLPATLPANAHLRASPLVGNERLHIDILTPADSAKEKKRSSSAKTK